MEAIAWLVNVPYTKLSWMTMLLELVMLDFELSFIVSPNLQRLDAIVNSVPQFDTILHKVVGWADFQTSITNLKQTRLAWIILILATLITVLVTLRITSYRSKIIPPGLWVRMTLQYSGYLFYFLILFSVSFELCQSISSRLLQKETYGDLPVLPSSSAALSAEDELTYTIVWVYDPTKKCLSGEYFIMSGISVLILCCAFILKMLHYKLATFYPEPFLADSLKSRLSLLHPAGFVLLHVFKHLILITRAASYIIPLYVIFGVFQASVLLINIIHPTMHNRFTIGMRMTKSAICLYVLFWMLFYRNNGNIFTSSLREVIFFLTSGLLLVLLLGVWRAVPHTNLSSEDLLYDFETLKVQPKNKGLWLVTLEKIKRHFRECSNVNCFCRQADGSLTKPWSSNQKDDYFLKYLSSMLKADIKLIDSNNSFNISERFEEIRRYIWFSVTNETKIIYSSILLAKLKVIKTFDVKTLYRAVELQLRRHVAYNTSIGSILTLPEPGDNGDVEVSSTYSLIEQLNMSMALAEEVVEAMNLKLVVINGLRTPGSENMIQRSAAYVRKIRIIDKNIKNLLQRFERHENRIQFLRVHYLRDVKEDLVSLRKLVLDLRITLNRGVMVKIGNLKLPAFNAIVGTASAAHHTVSYISSTIKALGHHPADLLGADLGRLMPSPMPAIHRMLYHSLEKKVGVVGSGSHTPGTNKLIVCIQRADQGIESASLAGRLNWSLARDVEFVGLLTPEPADLGELLICFDEYGKILETNRNAIRHYTIGNNIGSSHPNVMPYIKEELKKYPPTGPITLSDELELDLPAIVTSTGPLHKNLTCRLTRFCLLSVPFYLVRTNKDWSEDNEPLLVKTESKSKQDIPKTPAPNRQSSNFANKVNHQLVHQGDQSTPVHKLSHNTVELRFKRSITPLDKALTSSIRLTGVDSELRSGTHKEIVLEKSEDDKENEKVRTHRSELGSINFQPKDLLISRYLHHNMRVNTFNLLNVIVAFPMVALAIVLSTLMIRESDIIQKSEFMTYDALVLDASAYIAWVTTLHVEYIDVKRLVVEGVANQTTFDKFGFNGSDSHLLWLMNNSAYLYQGPVSEYRYNRMAAQSKFFDYYNFETIEGSELQILTYQVYPPTWSIKDMTPNAAIRYTQQYLDIMLIDPTYQEDHILGLGMDRRNSPYEEVVRYNSLNSMFRHFHKSRSVYNIVYSAAYGVIEDILIDLHSRVRAPIYAAGIGIFVILLSMSVFLFVLHKKARSLGRNMYSFDVADL